MADELYAASPDDFVERRNQRVAEARAAGNRPLAKSIGQLRRPTRSAWMVNLLCRESPDDVQQLLDLGPALAEAQQRGSGDDLRRLSGARHAAMDALVRRAVVLAATSGHVATEASRQEVTQTLQAALAEPAVAELVRTGRVSQPASYGGFGPMLLSPAEVAPAAAVPQPKPTGGAGEAEPSVDDLARGQAAAEVRAAADALAAAEQEATDATDDAQAATQQADELAEAVAALRDQLEQAESEERAASEAARAARQRAQQHQQLVRDAQRDLAEAQQALAKQT